MSAKLKCALIAAASLAALAAQARPCLLAPDERPVTTTAPVHPAIKLPDPCKVEPSDAKPKLKGPKSTPRMLGGQPSNKR